MGLAIAVWVNAVPLAMALAGGALWAMTGNRKWWLATVPLNVLAVVYVATSWLAA